MRHGFVKVAAATPDIRVADVEFNKENICRGIEEAEKANAKILVFPELCVTGYTCSDLFDHAVLLKAAKKALLEIAEFTRDRDLLVFVGVPLEVDGKLYNVAAALNHGKILGLTTKTFLPNYGEFYEMRQFTPGPEKARYISFNGEEIPFGPQILFQAAEMEDLIVAAEICEDVWSPVPPSIGAALEGATVLVNCSASDETIGKDTYRRELIAGQSARLIAGYIYANAGEGESTTDLVFGGHNIIAENGTILKESSRYRNEIIYSEFDLERIAGERRKNTTFQTAQERSLIRVGFQIEKGETSLTRTFPKKPFVPSDEQTRAARCEEILTIQAMGLKKRLAHTNARTAVVGISGGLDSTLALLVTAKAFDMLGRDKKDILAVTMPCFGTTDRTYQNACEMSKKVGATLIEVPIAEAVNIHFRDIGHDPEDHSVTYENGQARERTQVLMDLANKTWGMVIGTGDMSELALGWATYNGDHMSMYGVNASVPKTLVRHLVKYAADDTEDEQLREVLYDVLDTPVSPELLPPKDGDIAQKTEDLVGPYELHDFFLYFMLRFGYEPAKIYRLACSTFEGEYDRETILKWLKTFCRRFFSQQFKRSCLPDGPKVGTVALSPRGDWRMPSDASVAVWMKELETL
ncbi:NAD(+) synthase [[Ruminococcus] lactaris]|uniref:NAD(+) synthase n=1 Tax=[Ruminococcus] lactaris TaxID=46228 RepID=UPI00352120D8